MDEFKTWCEHQGYDIFERGDSITFYPPYSLDQDCPEVGEFIGKCKELTGLDVVQDETPGGLIFTIAM